MKVLNSKVKLGIYGSYITNNKWILHKCIFKKINGYFYEEFLIKEIIEINTGKKGGSYIKRFDIVDCEFKYIKNKYSKFKRSFNHNFQSKHVLVKNVNIIKYLLTFTDFTWYNHDNYVICKDNNLKIIAIFLCIEANKKFRNYKFRNFHKL